MPRFVISLLLLIVWGHHCHAQQRQVFFEEIQSRPDAVAGEWVIGGKELTANTSSQISPAELARPGMLAVVEFYVRDGSRVITRMMPQPIRASEITDGPYVIWQDATTAEVLTVEKGKVIRKLIEDLDEPRSLGPQTPLVKTITINPHPPAPQQSEWKMPPRLLAISDLEGNYDNALNFLKNNGVIDSDNKWNWGNGHLVLVGDLCDRGPQVTEIMWLIHRLEQEAGAAGGQVHYVLGNHEAMVMGGDLRYIHPKYHFVATRLGIQYDQLFGTQSEIGRWWRSKNAVVRVGNLLFVHGGYSPELDQAKLGLEELNRRIRAGLAPARPTGLTAAANPVLHQHGPFWYRGYFPQHAAEWGGLATEAEIKRILTRHDADHIVIGHTIVDSVGPLDKTGAVICIDVKWSDTEKCQGLLQEDGRLYRVTMNGKREAILVNAKK